MILTLSVYPSRTPDLLSWDRMRLDPTIPVNSYHDSFGNFCHVIRAPAGQLTMSTDFVVQDNGEPDMVAPQAEQHALENLPVEVLVYLLGLMAASTWLFSCCNFAMGINFGAMVVVSPYRGCDSELRDISDIGPRAGMMLHRGQ
jgi:hypothetical protein